ncbi:hypothetical protein [Vitiosangium sp. GDMCC 1.1324]|uniref:hypothetical protein n=1 Tax=Vitiosangium sp. (strain GDMCC 1.1324) TaxID=2138576 RepID=UPI000D342A6B|nr:hypothetical protein [Vitiosangium sp. GDMCC 1.1324]PTL78950.1 hypothetical protein DAT35_35580 [Vitiosangium sp. GDMCC 1.1324]
MMTVRMGALLFALTLPGCTQKPSETWKAEDGGIRCDTLQHLACTGLYGEGGQGWASRQTGPGVRSFEPGLQLWSDGLEKSRFIFLPPGTRVDSSRMDEWRFPVGTKLWKEFRWKGRRIETRFMWKQAEGSWLRTTYRWSGDESVALELTDGERDVPGTDGFEIPSQLDCLACHQGRGDGVLGFEAVALAHEAAKGLSLQRLVQEGLLTHPPTQELRIPGTPVEREALGWLHINCGVSCHNANEKALGSVSGPHLRLEVADLISVQRTDAFRTVVGVPSLFRPVVRLGGKFMRVAPGDTAHSTLLHRISSREPAVQMPPLGTHVVDEKGHALVQRWIESMQQANR